MGYAVNLPDRWRSYLPYPIAKLIAIGVVTAWRWAAPDVLAGRRPSLQLNVDATQMRQSFIGTGYVQSMIQLELQEFFQREHGTLEHLLVMPVRPVEIMLAKVLAMGALVLLASLLSLHFVVQGVLRMPIGGSLALFMLGAALHLFATTSMGIFLGTVARSMPQLALLIILVLLPLQMLSGGATPRESMPQELRSVMLLAPTTHFVSLAQAVLYRGAGLTIVWPTLLALAAIGTAFFFGASSRFRQSLASE